MSTLLASWAADAVLVVHGEMPRHGGFIDHYLTAAIYPEGLTREWQWVLGAGVLVVNGLAYGALLMRARSVKAAFAR